MRPIRPNTRHRSPWRTVLLAIAALAVGGAGTVAALAYFNVIDAAKLAFWRSNRASHKGLIPVPVAARSINAFAEITGYDLTDPKTGELAMVYMPPRAVPKGTILDVSKIRGRVAAHAIGAMYNFTEDAFLPEGTHPGVVGGTPEGKRAITLDAGKIHGVHDLKMGDHFDLFVSIPVDMPGAGRSSAGQSGMSVVAAPDVALQKKQCIVRPLVQDGVVVIPVRIRGVPIGSSAAAPGKATRTKPVEEIVLAVEPIEAERSAQAINLKYEITCAARSGRPTKHTLPAAQSSKDDPPAGRAGRGRADKDQAASDILPDLDPFANIRYLEIMIGAQRQFVLFNGPGNSPVVAFQDGNPAKSKSDVEEDTE